MSNQRPIVGWQVDIPETGECWGDRMSFEIITDRSVAEVELAEAHAAGHVRYRILDIREGDVEEPLFVER